MTPDEILATTYSEVSASLEHNWVEQAGIIDNVTLVSRSIQNRAGVRVLLACALAKVHHPSIDIRKPYTEIDDTGAFSGRTYDERFVGPFVAAYELPCNPTTAFLTPALRNRNTTLTPESNLSGRPREVYTALLQLLTDVYTDRISAKQLLAETIRQLILFRDERKRRIESLLATLKSSHDDVSLSAEQIITIIEQHLATKGASRLPVLIIAAAYTTISSYLGEYIQPLEAHNAADRQTKALGDVQIVLEAGGKIVTCYEMKLKRVTTEDIDLAVREKIARTRHIIDNYIFITTDVIEPQVATYARSMFDKIGVEIVILDCIGFLRHFLHLFHRHRMAFLDEYQNFVLAEPESAVSQPVKEVFLTLRQAAESN